MQRIIATELLDSAHIPPSELSGNLCDLSWLNRWTGTTSATLQAMASLLIAKNLYQQTIFDVGTGAGDLPQAVLHWADQRHQRLHVWAGDLHPDVLHYARTHSPATGWLHMNALQLPIADQAVDVALCVQVAHHLEPEPLRQLLVELRRVSRVGFVLVDLERGLVAFAAIWLLTHIISRNRLTRYDGPLSARRAYTRHEIMLLAQQAGIQLSMRSVMPFRWIAIWTREDSS